MQIAAFFIILMQLIAESCYSVYFHNGNIHPVPTGVCYGGNTTFQLLVWAKDTIIWIHWQHLSFHTTAWYRLQSWKMSLESSGATVFASHGAGWVSSSHQVSCTRTWRVPSLLGSIQDHGSRSAQELCLWPAHGSRVRPTWLEAAGQNRCSWSSHLPDTRQLYLNACPSQSAQHLAGISSRRSWIWSYCPLVAAQKRPQLSLVSQLHEWYLPIQADINFL